MVQTADVPRLLICGVAAGLTLVSKNSGLFVLPVLCVLAVIEILTQNAEGQRNGECPPPWLRMTGALATIGATACVVLWAFYGFRYHARPDGLAMLPSLADYARETQCPFCSASSPVCPTGICYLRHICMDL